MVEGVGEFGVEALEVGDDLLDVVAAGGVLVGAGLDLLVVAVVVGPLLQGGVADEAEGTDEGHGEVVHGHLGAHGGELSLEGEVHEGGLHEVVAMVAEGNLVATVGAGGLKEFLATLPGTAEARRGGTHP